MNPRRRRIARQRKQDRRANEAALSGSVHDLQQLARVQAWARTRLVGRHVFVQSVRAHYTFNPHFYSSSPTSSGLWSREQRK